MNISAYGWFFFIHTTWTSNQRVFKRTQISQSNSTQAVHACFFFVINCACRSKTHAKTIHVCNYTGKCVTHGNHMVCIIWLSCFGTHMIITWLSYENHMIIIWLSYVQYHMIVIWLPYDYHMNRAPYDYHMWHIWLCTNWCALYCLAIRQSSSIHVSIA